MRTRPAHASGRLQRFVGGTVTERSEGNGGADKASCGHQPRVMRQLPARSGDAGGYQWEETMTIDAARNPKPPRSGAHDMSGRCQDMAEGHETQRA